MKTRNLTLILVVIVLVVCTVSLIGCGVFGGNNNNSNNNNDNNNGNGGDSKPNPTPNPDSNGGGSKPNPTPTPKPEVPPFEETTISSNDAKTLVINAFNTLDQEHNFTVNVDNDPDSGDSTYSTIACRGEGDNEVVISERYVSIWNHSSTTQSFTTNYCFKQNNVVYQLLHAYRRTTSQNNPNGSISNETKFGNNKGTQTDFVDRKATLKNARSAVSYAFNSYITDPTAKISGINMKNNMKHVRIVFDENDKTGIYHHIADFFIQNDKIVECHVKITKSNDTDFKHTIDSYVHYNETDRLVLPNVNSFPFN